MPDLDFIYTNARLRISFAEYQSLTTDLEKTFADSDKGGLTFLAH
jgi:hypothetical protein